MQPDVQWTFGHPVVNRPKNKGPDSEVMKRFLHFLGTS